MTTHLVAFDDPSPSSHFFLDPVKPLMCALTLHDALPISRTRRDRRPRRAWPGSGPPPCRDRSAAADRSRQGGGRSEEHTSELQSRGHLVCRLLREKYNSRRV